MTASSRFVVACRARVGAPLPAPPAHRWTRRARSPLARRPRSCGGARRSRAFCRRRLASTDPRTSAAAARAPPAARRGSTTRLSVVAKSSKASKVGRFPHVPSTDAHPIVRDGLDLGELCATWRAGAGAPGAAVVRDLEAMMMEAPREARRRRAATSLWTKTRPPHPGDRGDLLPLVLAPPPLSQERELVQRVRARGGRGVARKLRAVRRPLRPPSPRPPRPPRPPRRPPRGRRPARVRPDARASHRARRGASGERHVTPRRPDGAVPRRRRAAERSRPTLGARGVRDDR